MRSLGSCFFLVTFFVCSVTFAEGFSLSRSLKSLSGQTSVRQALYENRGSRADSLELTGLDDVQEPLQIDEPVAAPLQEGILACGGGESCDCWRCSLKNHKTTGYISLRNYVFDRNFNVFGMALGADLPLDLQYYHYINFDTPNGSGWNRDDWYLFFSEFNLRRPIAKDCDPIDHLDWTYQHVDGSGSRNAHRFGVRWRFRDMEGPISTFLDKIKLSYDITFHAIETDGSGWQMEHVYFGEYCDGGIYITGTTDHDINGEFDNSNSSWFSEHEIGVRVFEARPLYMIAAWRYNSYVAKRFKRSWAFGFNYEMRFQ